MSRNVYLAQIPYQFQHTKTVYFPYSVGMLWSSAQTDANIRREYRLAEIMFLREDIGQVVSRMQRPDVLGISCYVWNLNYSMRLAAAVKARWPQCLIVAGGPSIAVEDDRLFERHPYLDVAIYREGEHSFRQLLDHRWRGIKLDSIPGLGLNRDLEVSRTEISVRIEDLDSIPSPYLMGVFDHMTDQARDHGLMINGIIETNRGCPYHCTFCDWGNGVLGKVKRFDLRRVKKELLWLARNQVEYVTNCDANFGIYQDRDREITRFLVRLKKRYGFPKLFDTNWPKNNSAATVDIAETLFDAGMLRRFTNSIQSNNTDTLIAIKRSNLSESKVNDILRMSRERGIDTSTELIMGLPQETFDSFQDSFVSMIEKGTYPSTTFLTILPNSEMAQPEYRVRYGLITKMMPRRYIYEDEYDEVVVATNTMTEQELERLILWCWFVQQFHFQGYTQVLYDFVKRRYHTPIKDFYNRLLEIFLEPRPHLPNSLLAPLARHFRDDRTGMLDIGVINYELHDDIGKQRRDETFQGIARAAEQLVTPEDQWLVPDIMLLQEKYQLSPHREQMENFVLHSNLWQFLYKDHCLESGRFEYTVCQPEPAARYGEFLVNARYNRRWQTEISPVVDQQR